MDSSATRYKLQEALRALELVSRQSPLRIFNTVQLADILDYAEDLQAEVDDFVQAVQEEYVERF